MKIEITKKEIAAIKNVINYCEYGEQLHCNIKEEIDTLNKVWEENKDKKTYDDFYETYTVVDNPFTENGSYDNKLFETYGDEYKAIQKAVETNPKTVWTLIDGDDGEVYIVAGWHYINRIGYFITEQEFENTDEEYQID